MVDLDDKNHFEAVLSFEINEAFTYGNGNLDTDRRERIRSIAHLAMQSKNLQIEPGRFSWFAFRIRVYKSGIGDFDVDNVPKPYIDAFCEKQISKDKSRHGKLAFYKDDTIDHVKYFEIYGERIEDKNDERTRVEVFGRKRTAD